VGIGTRGIALGFDMVAGGGGGADVVDMVISGVLSFEF